jgi:hypothetical protein
MQLEASAPAPDLLAALEQIAAMERLPIGDASEEMGSRLQAARIAQAALEQARGTLPAPTDPTARLAATVRAAAARYIAGRRDRGAALEARAVLLGVVDELEEQRRARR